MKIRPARPDFFHEVWRTDEQVDIEKLNSRFSGFCEHELQFSFCLTDNAARELYKDHSTSTV